MYEPIRTKSVHSTVAADDTRIPHRSREEELDIQLAGHLSALLAVTDELGLTEAGDAIARQIARLRGGLPPRAAPRSSAPRWRCGCGSRSGSSGPTTSRCRRWRAGWTPRTPSRTPPRSR